MTESDELPHEMAKAILCMARKAYRGRGHRKVTLQFTPKNDLRVSLFEEQDSERVEAKGRG